MPPGSSGGSGLMKAGERLSRETAYTVPARRTRGGRQAASARRWPACAGGSSTCALFEVREPPRRRRVVGKALTTMPKAAAGLRGHPRAGRRPPARARRRIDGLLAYQVNGSGGVHDRRCKAADRGGDVQSSHACCRGESRSGRSAALQERAPSPGVPRHRRRRAAAVAPLRRPHHARRGARGHGRPGRGRRRPASRSPVHRQGAGARRRASTAPSPERAPSASGGRAKRKP